eukprot:729552-Amphidinium_carterae.1
MAHVMALLCGNFLRVCRDGFSMNHGRSRHLGNCSTNPGGAFAKFHKSHATNNTQCAPFFRSEANT